MKTSVTSPIFYVNDKPHIGHVYTSVISDIITKSINMTGERAAVFISGTDEHGIKVFESSKKVNIPYVDFINANSSKFSDMLLSINAADLIFHRTSSEKHIRDVIYIWNLLSRKGYIYKGNYKGWYSISDEAFYTERDIFKEGEKYFAKKSKSEVREVEHESYFLKISALKPRIKDVIINNQILDSAYMQEALNALEDLGDLSISRKDGYGITVPGDDKHTIYVWLDALISYISASNGVTVNDRESYWPAAVQVLGKDILKFHAIYWIGILIAIDFPLPEKLVVHGWLLNGGNKISKSLSNAIDFSALIDRYSSDGLRYILARVYSSNSDINFSYDFFDEIYNTGLVNGISNLFNRVISLIHKKSNGIIRKNNTIDKDLSQEVLEHLNNAIDGYKGFDIKCAINSIDNAAKILNAYISNNEIWNHEGLQFNTTAYSVMNCMIWTAIAAIPIVNSFKATLSVIGIHNPRFNIIGKSIIHDIVLRDYTGPMFNRL